MYAATTTLCTNVLIRRQHCRDNSLVQRCYPGVVYVLLCGATIYQGVVPLITCIQWTLSDEPPLS